jgi:hypothetical protein
MLDMYNLARDAVARADAVEGEFAVGVRLNVGTYWRGEGGGDGSVGEL